MRQGKTSHTWYILQVQLFVCYIQDKISIHIKRLSVRSKSGYLFKNMITQTVDSNGRPDYMRPQRGRIKSGNGEARMKLDS